VCVTHGTVRYGAVRAVQYGQCRTATRVHHATQRSMPRQPTTVQHPTTGQRTTVQQTTGQRMGHEGRAIHTSGATYSSVPQVVIRGSLASWCCVRACVRACVCALRADTHVIPPCDVRHLVYLYAQ
jgi:hypothetical protein